MAKAAKTTPKAKASGGRRSRAAPLVLPKAASALGAVAQGEEAAALAGCRSESIEERLGYRGRSVMIHRDELVLFEHER